MLSDGKGMKKICKSSFYYKKRSKKVEIFSYLCIQIIKMVIYV